VGSTWSNRLRTTFGISVASVTAAIRYSTTTVRSLVLVCCERQVRMSKAIGGDGVGEHQHALGLFDHRPRLREFGDDLIGDLPAILGAQIGDVDVEPGRPGHLTVLIEHPVADDDDVMDSVGGVDDAVPAAEWLPGGDHLVEDRGDLRVIVGVFVGEQQFGGRGDLAGGVAVQGGDSVGPFPAVSVEEEPETAHPLRCPGADDLVELTHLAPLPPSTS
jgi:hypothetical protein